MIEVGLYLIAGLGSALISGMTGLAGGVLLLIVLALILPLEAVIPLHALIQVIANFSRIILLRDHIQWNIWLAFNALAIPAGLLGAYCAQDLPHAWIRLGIGVVIIIAAIFALRAPKNTEITTVSRARYVILGFVSSLLGMIVGASGPLIAPFFMIGGLTRERFIATKSACQLTIQLIKTVIFAQILSFSYQAYSTEILVTTIGVFGGTWAARRLLAKIKGQWLEKGVILILFIFGGKMIWTGLLEIAQ